MKIRIPLAKPEITEADREAVLGVLRTSSLSMGPKLQEFEQAICDYTGSKHAVAVNSGTSALQIAIHCLGLEHGAEVILPSFSFAALLNGILQEGLQPKFVDIDPETYNTTPDLVAAAITERTQLIIAVHTFGIPVDGEGLFRLIENPPTRPPRQGIHFIEDACEALGAEVYGRRVGSFGDAGTFAFYPNKQITTGEGGVLITSNHELATRARRLRNQGRDPECEWYQQSEVGFSCRLSDINCALGISQLNRLENIVARRQKLAELYDRGLANIAEIQRPPLTCEHGRISWFVYPVRLQPDFTRSDRDWICQSLCRKGIATGKYFAPLHRQPVLITHNVRNSTSLAHTEAIADRVIALPFFNELSELEIHEVCGALEESLRELRRKM
jgi:perosamine synthetase